MRAPTEVHLSDFDGWVELNRAVKQFRDEVAKLLPVSSVQQDPNVRQENVDLKNASAAALSWLAGSKIEVRLRDGYRRDAGAVPCGYWETPIGPRSLITGVVQIGAVTGIAMVPRAIVDLKDQYLDELHQSLRWRGGAQPSDEQAGLPKSGPPMADFRDSRKELDPVKRLVRETEVAEYQRQIAEGKVAPPVERPPTLARVPELGSKSPGQLAQVQESEAGIAGTASTRQHGPPPTRTRIEDAAARLIDGGLVPGQTIQWEPFRTQLCKAIGVPLKQRGYSLDTIQAAVKILLKNRNTESTESTES
jgi:hypothetical protein